MDDCAGDDCDILAWKNFAKWGFEKEGKDLENKIKVATLWKNKDWPLN
jgi:hypothetical protein